MSDMQELGTPTAGVGEVGQNPTTPTLEPQDGNRQPAQQDGGKQEQPPAWSGNLDDLPQFREVKSKYDRTTSQLQKELDKLREERQQDTQRAQWLEQRLEEIQTQGMDEPQRAQYEMQKLQRMNQQLMQQIQHMQMGSARDRALMQMQQRATQYGVNVSLEELSEQKDPDAAWEYVLRKGHESWNASRKQEQRQQKQEANAPYLGGGGGSSRQTELQGKYDQAVKKYDAGAMLDAMQLAANEGITLDI